MEEESSSKGKIVVGIVVVMLVAVGIGLAVYFTNQKKEEPPKVDCKMSEWTYGNCNLTTGKKPKTRTVIQQPQNGGAACGILESYEDCPVDCEFTKTYGDCNRSTGLKPYTVNITKESKNGGVECPDLAGTEECEQDCQYIWENTTCDTDNTKQLQSVKITSPSLRGGICNVSDGQSREIDLYSPWSEWGTCDTTTNQKSRTRNTIYDTSLTPSCNISTEEKVPCLFHTQIDRLGFVPTKWTLPTDGNIIICDSAGEANLFYSSDRNYLLQYISKFGTIVNSSVVISGSPIKVAFIRSVYPTGQSYAPYPQNTFPKTINVLNGTFQTFDLRNSSALISQLLNSPSTSTVISSPPKQYLTFVMYYDETNPSKINDCYIHFI